MERKMRLLFSIGLRTGRISQNTVANFWKAYYGNICFTLTKVPFPKEAIISIMWTSVRCRGVTSTITLSQEEYL